MRTSRRAKAYRRKAALENENDDLLVWRLWFYVSIGVGALAAPSRTFDGLLGGHPWARVALLGLVITIGMIDYLRCRRKRQGVWKKP